MSERRSDPAAVLPDARRLSYLDRMGVSVWRLRADEAAQEGKASEAAEPQASASAAQAAAGKGGPVSEVSAQGGVEALDWTALAERVRDCRACALAEGRTQTVFGVGNRQADWLVVGEAPGAEEDRQGEPFVGRAGRLLDAMLRAVGQDRSLAYIANVVKCRPPGNRDPRAEEVAACRGYLARQIALIRPGVILCVGRISAHHLLDTEVPVGRLRGRVHRLSPGIGGGLDDIPVVVTYHPAYLLRSPAEKAKVWSDLCLARRALAGGAL